MDGEADFFIKAAERDLAAHDADGSEGGGIGSIDTVSRGRDVVAAGGCERINRSEDGLVLSQIAYRLPDDLGSKGGPAGRIDPDHGTFDARIVADFGKCLGDGTGADGFGGEQSLPLAGFAG